jgi:mannose-6-phosphate isomerase
MGGMGSALRSGARVFLGTACAEYAPVPTQPSVMLLLKNTIQQYAWGSRTRLADLLGLPSPAPAPQAEIWMGAHQTAPSSVLQRGEWQSLSSWIENDPGAVLGERVHRAYGSGLPFLLKVLAVETPLSLQAHPSRAQALVGFEAEQAANVPLTARPRNYKDRNHKPELLCALTRFDALCGFRRASDSLRLLEALDVPDLGPYTAMINRDRGPAGLEAAFSALVTGAPDHKRMLAEKTVEALEKRAGRSVDFAAEIDWARRIAKLYPGDVGIVCALLLNLVRLEPGQAFYVPVGCLHAYLEGMAVEIMASSDNVLRGGLTQKHVDAGELLRVLDFKDGSVPVLPGEDRRPGERVFVTEAPEFELSMLDLAGAKLAFPSRVGPEILLCTAGNAVVRGNGGELRLERGASAFVTGTEGDFEIEGAGRVFRAAVRSA